MFHRVVSLVHFYLLYVLLIIIKCNILFVDDTTIYLSSNNFTNLLECIEHNKNSLFNWLCANKLSLNVLKTIFLLLKPKKAVT